LSATERWPDDLHVLDRLVARKDKPERVRPEAQDRTVERGAPRGVPDLEPGECAPLSELEDRDQACPHVHHSGVGRKAANHHQCGDRGDDSGERPVDRRELRTHPPRRHTQDDQRDGSPDPRAAGKGHDPADHGEQEPGPVRDSPAVVLLGERQAERDGQQQDKKPAEQVRVAVGRERAVGLEGQAAPGQGVDADILHHAVETNERTREEQRPGKRAYARETIEELHGKEVHHRVVDEGDKTFEAPVLAEHRRGNVHREHGGKRYPAQHGQDEVVDLRPAYRASVDEDVVGPGGEGHERHRTLHEHLDDVELVEGDGHGHAGQPRPVADRERDGEDEDVQADPRDALCAGHRGRDGRGRRGTLLGRALVAPLAGLGHPRSYLAPLPVSTTRTVSTTICRSMDRV
jgi:hypothetical protein